MNGKKVYLDGISTALAPTEVTQERAAAFLGESYAGRLRPGSLRLLGKVLSHPSVRKRRFAFASPAELVDEDPDARAARFTRWAVGLSAKAAAGALRRSGLAPGDVGALVLNTCTGYICPGVSTYLHDELGLPRSVPSYDLVGSGCGGAVPNLQLARALACAGGGPALSVSVEICSATFQMGDDPGLLVSNAIFGDGAAAVVSPRPSGFELVASASRFAQEYREDIRFVHRNGQLHNQLSVRLPGLAAAAAGELTESLLGGLGLRAADVRRWALHPGGENVLNAVRDRLALDEEELRFSRRVLAGSGNMSSATVWFVLDEMEREGIAPGELVMMLAFGAGLSAHAYLLRKA